MRANQSAAGVFRTTRHYCHVACVFLLLLCSGVQQVQSAGNYFTPFSAYVTSAALKIRSGPGMSHSQIGLLHHGEKVRVIAYAGSWRKIQRGTRDAYVSANYLSLTPSTSRSSPHFGGPTSVLKKAFNSGPTINSSNDLNVADYHATVTASALNVRKGPGTKYSIHKSIGYGQTVKVTHHQGLWLRIQWSAGLAYVHGNYLKRKDAFEGVIDIEGLIPAKSKSTQSSSSIIAASGNSTSRGLEMAGLLPSAACNWQKPTSFINNYFVTAFKKTQMRGQPHDNCPAGNRHLAPGGKGRVVAEKGDWVYLQNTATDYYGWAYKPSLFINKSRDRTSVLSDSGFSQTNRSSGNQTNCNQTFGPTRSLLAPLQKSIEELIDQPIKGDRNNNGCPSDTAIINVALAIGANPFEAADAGRRANANILYESNCWDDFLTKSNFLSAAQLELDIKTCRIAARLSNNKFPVSAYLEFARAWGPGGACLAAELDDDWTAGNTAWCVFDIAASAVPSRGASDNLVRAGIRKGKTARVIRKSPELKYSDHIRKRAVQNPGGHHFPFSYDRNILATSPVTLKRGGQGYAIKGYRNGKLGVYNIVVRNDVITHRDWVSEKKWPQRSSSFGWPIEFKDIPTS